MTMTLVGSLIPLLLGGLLAWTGAGKLLSRSLPAQAARTALPRLVRGTPRRAALVLRATGAAEVLLAAGLLAAPATPAAPAPGAATAVLGAGFLAYLGYARAVAPESSCGCSAREEAPVTWHSFVRAGVVALGGALAAVAAEPWWREAGDHPAAAAALLAAGAAGLAYLSAGPERRWQLPLRRLRLRLSGHPLHGPHGPDGTDGTVPVAASVELLERSLAFQVASPVVRSGLIEHWDEDGWRILHYTGTHRPGGRERPVSVLFAMDAAADLDHAQGHVVRVSVVDQETEEVVTAQALDGLGSLDGLDGRLPPAAQPQLA
jgi:hypothetical protein